MGFCRSSQLVPQSSWAETTAVSTLWGKYMDFKVIWSLWHFIRYVTRAKVNITHLIIFISYSALQGWRAQTVNNSQALESRTAEWWSTDHPWRKGECWTCIYQALHEQWSATKKVSEEGDKIKGCNWMLSDTPFEEIK